MVLKNLDLKEDPCIISRDLSTLQHSPQPPYPLFDYPPPQRISVIFPLNPGLTFSGLVVCSNA